MSRAVRGPEAACDALIEKLAAELPAKLAEINAENDDPYELAPPAGISFGPRSEPPLPWISVQPDGPDQPVDTSGRLHFRERIRVVTWLDDGDEEALARRASRWRTAVREVCLHYRRPGIGYNDVLGGYGLQLESEDPGPTFAGAGEEAGKFVTWTSSTFTVQQQQDLG